MKKLLLLALIGLFSGCDPELTTVNDCNPKLPIIEHSHTHFNTIIKYDYSKIDNFNETNVHAVVVLDSSVHSHIFNKIKDEKVLAALYELKPNFKNNIDVVLREDNIKERSNGYLKIDCSDTKGYYILVYVE